MGVNCEAINLLTTEIYVICMYTRNIMMIQTPNRKIALNTGLDSIDIQAHESLLLVCSAI